MSTFGFAQDDALSLFRGQGLFGPLTNHHPLQLGEQGQHCNHRQGLNILLIFGQSQILFDNYHLDLVINQLINEGNDFAGAPAQAAQLGDNQGIACRKDTTTDGRMERIFLNSITCFIRFFHQSVVVFFIITVTDCQ